MSGRRHSQQAQVIQRTRQVHVVKCLVFDVETEPFSEAFAKAGAHADRVRHAPRMRLACVFDVQARRYRFFLPSEAGKLIAMLRGATEVVSFNGKRFDLPVLERHHGLIGHVPRVGHHVDLCEILCARAGGFVSLNQTALLNLGEGKHTGGRKIASLDLEALKIANRSDVMQTYELWKLERRGLLRCPTFHSQLEEDEPGPENPILEVARVLGTFGVDEPGEMSDGEQAEYLALEEGGGDSSWAMDFFDLP